MKKSLHKIHDYFEKSFFQKPFFFGLSGTASESALSDFQIDVDQMAHLTEKSQPR